MRLPLDFQVSVTVIMLKNFLWNYIYILLLCICIYTCNDVYTNIVVETCMCVSTFTYTHKHIHTHVQCIMINNVWKAAFLVALCNFEVCTDLCMHIYVCCRFFLKQMKKRKDSWPEQISKLRWFPFWVIVHQRYALYVVSISPAFSTLSVTYLVVEKVWYLIFNVFKIRQEQNHFKIFTLYCL